MATSTDTDTDRYHYLNADTSQTGMAIELYRDSFSGQVHVDVAGIGVYDTVDQDKARGVYDFLGLLGREALAAIVDEARAK